MPPVIGYRVNTPSLAHPRDLRRAEEPVGSRSCYLLLIHLYFNAILTVLFIEVFVQRDWGPRAPHPSSLPATMFH